MATEVDLISRTDLLNLKRAAQMIRKLNDELIFIAADTRMEVMGRVSPLLIERAFTNYDD
jgi:hypothetical protein